MKITENGLVLREVKVGEADKILTLLTSSLGIISVSAKGSMRPKSKFFSASGLFCYSEWLLREGRNYYFVDEASPIEVFFGLRQSIEGIALATYLCEILQILLPSGEEAERLLKLALNSLYLLAGQKRAPELVKAVFELRSLTEAGFMPDLLACAECSEHDGGGYFFDARQGLLFCNDCAGKYGGASNLSAGALAALRHAVLAEDDEVFSFRLEGQGLAQFCRVAEDFTLYHLDYAPKSLAFLKSMLVVAPGHEDNPSNNEE